jgi:hypothetical protein
MNLMKAMKKPTIKGDIKDKATIEQLVVLPNLESINTLLMHNGLRKVYKLI